ncbi:MAG: hypothetical protein ACPW60_15150 [Methylohalobius sp. ZOD2]
MGSWPVWAIYSNSADEPGGQPEGKGRKNTLGFALTQLQRRLASSPEAIYQSLKRRRKRLEEEKLIARGEKVQEGVAETLGEYAVKKQIDLPDNLDELDEELSAEEYELYADQVVDQATADESQRLHPARPLYRSQGPAHRDGQPQRNHLCAEPGGEILAGHRDRGW